MARPEGILTAFERGEHAMVSDLWAVSSAGKEEVNYVSRPPLFRLHWSHVLLDDTDMFGRTGGGGYDAYGIDKERGVIVVVRLDGHVGIVTPLESLRDVDVYFASFMAKV